MVMKLSNIVAGFAVFAFLVIIVVSMWNGFKENYDLTDTDTKNNTNVGDRLNEINALRGIERIITATHSSEAPTGSTADVLGSLASAGVGVVQFSGGVLTAPVEIFGAITDFYYIPPVVPIALAILLTIYVGYIIIAAYLGRSDI